jgi:hypothetical protein
LPAIRRPRNSSTARKRNFLGVVLTIPILPRIYPPFPQGVLSARKQP